MNASQLDAAAAAVHRAANAAGFAAAHTSAAQVTGQAAQFDKAIEQAQAAKDAAETALHVLLALGAKRPGASVARDTLRLDQLDTPASRALLAALEQAAEAGARLDRERGWTDKQGNPTGFGETLEGMAYQLRTEIHGPDNGGRE